MNNVFKEWITTLIGVFIFLVGMFFVWFEKIPWYALIAFAIVAYWLVKSKDDVLKDITNGFIDKLKP